MAALFVVVSGHVLTPQSNQFCAVHGAEYAVHDAKLCISKKNKNLNVFVTRCQNLRLKCTNSILDTSMSQTPLVELTVLLRRPPTS